MGSASRALVSAKWQSFVRAARPIRNIKREPGGGRLEISSALWETHQQEAEILLRLSQVRNKRQLPETQVCGMPAFPGYDGRFRDKYSGQIKLYSFCPKKCAIIKTNKEREHGFQKN